MKKISLIIMTAFYIGGGINHFVNPQFYIPLIPPYFGFPELINVAAGVVEVLFGLLLISKQTRKSGVYGIMLMLIAFIPSHIYFIQIGGCIDEGLCAPAWVGWIRLVLVHPLLIYWAWSQRD